MPRGLVFLVLTLCVAFRPPSPAQGQSLAVPESIRAEGVPPVPASLAAALNRYQNIRAASFQDWDDTSDRAMYITTRFADTPQVHHVAVSGGDAAAAHLPADRVLGVRPGPGTTSSSTRRTREGPRTTSSSSRIAPAASRGGSPTARAATSRPAWSPSGELLAWSSNARNGRDMDLYLAAPADPHFQRRLKEVSGQWTVADWSPDEIQGRRRGIHLDQ